MRVGSGDLKPPVHRHDRHIPERTAALGYGALGIRRPPCQPSVDAPTDRRNRDRTRARHRPVRRPERDGVRAVRGRRRSRLVVPPAPLRAVRHRRLLRQLTLAARVGPLRVERLEQLPPVPHRSADRRPGVVVEAGAVVEIVPDDLRPLFEDEFRALLREAYPADASGRVILPFRRIFVVARKADAQPVTA